MLAIFAGLLQKFTHVQIYFKDYALSQALHHLFLLVWEQSKNVSACSTQGKVLTGSYRFWLFSKIQIISYKYYLEPEALRRKYFNAVLSQVQ